MTDQTESVSEYAELLADLDFYDEDHWRNVMRQYPGAQDTIRKAAAAIRALKAKVREKDGVIFRQAETIGGLRADRDRIAAELRGTQTRLSEMAGTVEKLTTDRKAGERDYCALMDRHDALVNEVARLTSELAAARENEARWLWMFPDDATISVTERMQRVYRKWDGCDSWNAAVDAARRAGGEG